MAVPMKDPTAGKETTAPLIRTGVGAGASEMVVATAALMEAAAMTTAAHAIFFISMVVKNCQRGLITTIADGVLPVWFLLVCVCFCCDHEKGGI
ncbi:UNVERIFIED_CONTAM: hypothetical protein Sradi_3343000 [Sesamum radiatum]|uniref:Uncharacterized protein n=1 Tax=Sesamum radiatum TaxID=300843 RepID=A0AAW2R391_SESRA